MKPGKFILVVNTDISNMWTMRLVHFLFLSITVVKITAFGSFELQQSIQRVTYQYEVEKWLNEVDSDLLNFTALASRLTWQLTTEPNEKYSEWGKEVCVVRNKWKNKVCESDIKSEWLNDEQKRKWFMLCRGPKFSNNGILDFVLTMGKLAEIYNSEICLPNDEEFIKFHQNVVGNNALALPKPGECVTGEPDLEKLMRRQDLDAHQLKWIWELWHNSVGPRIKDPFYLLVGYENEAAQRNGYNDIGQVWREELEMPDLETFVANVYEEIKPVYSMLHAVVRHKLYEKYGSPTITLHGPIPVHLLGNMWAQDWSALIDLFIPEKLQINLNKKLSLTNHTIVDMVRESEDFYTSIGMPKMTQKFWKYSIFQKSENVTLCHGSAANLFNNGDFRIMMCGKGDSDDFYVIHHEMGHVAYYMAYEQQPAVFQEGTNTAFHESIGDAIMHGVLTPQHLHRLGLLTDEELFDENTELVLLLYQALSKLPEIPYALLIDKYRWSIFRGDIEYENLNEIYWKMHKYYRGIVPPTGRNENFFDVGAKFHIPDGTPYIRYFLSSIIQMQIFKSMCELSIYGRNSKNQYEETTLPLHRCDIYGSKRSGKRLLEMMQQGSSIHWTKALEILTGSDKISTKALLKYYQPVYNWLQKYIEIHNLVVGW